MAAWLQAEIASRQAACGYCRGRCPPNANDLLDGGRSGGQPGYVRPLFRSLLRRSGHLCFLLDEPPAAALVAHNCSACSPAKPTTGNLLTRERAALAADISRRQQADRLDRRPPMLCLLPVRQTALGPAR